MSELSVIGYYLRSCDRTRVDGLRVRCAGRTGREPPWPDMRYRMRKRPAGPRPGRRVIIKFSKIHMYPAIRGRKSRAHRSMLLARVVSLSAVPSHRLRCPRPVVYMYRAGGPPAPMDRRAPDGRRHRPDTTRHSAARTAHRDPREGDAHGGAHATYSRTVDGTPHRTTTAPDTRRDARHGAEPSRESRHAPADSRATDSRVTCHREVFGTRAPANENSLCG
jgi:hypothetical protein